MYPTKYFMYPPKYPIYLPKNRRYSSKCTPPPQNILDIPVHNPLPKFPMYPSKYVREYNLGGYTGYLGGYIGNFGGT